MKTLIAIAALLPGLAMSGEMVIGLHLGSQHYPQRGQNNVNPGLYVRTADGWTAGAYHNSHRKLSAYVGRTWDRDFYGHPVLPMAIPSIATAAVDGWRARLAYVPRFEKNANVGHFSIEKQF